MELANKAALLDEIKIYRLAFQARLRHKSVINVDLNDFLDHETMIISALKDFMNKADRT